MTELNPPVGYEVVTDGNGVWGDGEALFDDSTKFHVGNSSVKFANPAVQTGTWIVLKQIVIKPCAPGDLLRVGGWVYADEKTGDDNLRLGIDWYDEDDVYVSTSWVLAAVEANAADVWEYHEAILKAPAGAHGWRVFYGKDVAAEGVWWNSIWVWTVPAIFYAILKGDEVVGNGGRIHFNDDSGTTNTVRYDPAGLYDTVTGLFTARRSGRHAFSVRALCETMTAGEAFGIDIYRNSFSLAPGTWGYAHADGNVIAAVASVANCWLDAGDTVKVLAIYNVSENRTISGAANIPLTFFAGGEL
jgi:hypothetical protein